VTTWRILRRLLWRECRENWLFLLAGILLLAFIHVLRPFSDNSSARSTITTMLSLFLSLLLSLWAISRGSATRRRFTFDFRHLPLAPRLDAAVSLMLPTSIAALIGAGAGFCWTQDIQNQAPPQLIWLGIIFMMANFTSCYLLSATAALLPAVLLAVAWILPAAIIETIVIDDLDPSRLILQTYPYFTSIALGALSGMCVYTALNRRVPSLSGRVTAILLLCALPLGMFIMQRPWLSTNDQRMVATLQDSALRLDLHYHAQSTTLGFTDHREDFGATRDFAGRIVPCAHDSQGEVLLLQQSLREARVRLLCWTPRNNKLWEEACIPAGNGALEIESYWLENCSSLSPDNGYLLLALRSRLGQYNDLWLVDRRLHVARLLLPNGVDAIATKVRWCGRQAYCSGRNVYGYATAYLRIDLDAQRAEMLSLPAPRKVQ